MRKTAKRGSRRPGKDTPARRLRAVEEAAGLPRGTIVAKFLRRLVAEWIKGEPGSLSRWIDTHFVFEGGPAEQAQIRRELFRLESRWREEEALQESRGVG